MEHVLVFVSLVLQRHGFEWLFRDFALSFQVGKTICGLRLHEVVVRIWLPIELAEVAAAFLELNV